MSTRLGQNLLGSSFQNPVLLAAGTCGYGAEYDDLLDLDALGGLVTKAVTIEPRAGNAAPRAAEFSAGMLNSIGLANVGVEVFAAEKLPWLERRLERARILVNVAGRSPAEFAQVVRRLDPLDGFLGFEINVSCPNVKEGGRLFSAAADSLTEVVRAVRAETARPLSVKLSPNVPDIAAIAEAAVAAGADALTLINTFPGLLFDVATRRPLLGAGSGGVSGPAILPMGVHAVAQARRRVDVPIIGVGGIRTGADVMQYLLAGASLVQIGTASFADPRAAQRVLKQLMELCERHGVGDVADVIGTGATS